MSIGRRRCVFGVRGSDFQAFSCSDSETRWYTCFLRESGRSCDHEFNSWDLGEGKKQTSVLAMLRNKAAPSTSLPDSRRGDVPISSSISGSDIKTSVLLI